MLTDLFKKYRRTLTIGSWMIVITLIVIGSAMAYNHRHQIVAAMSPEPETFTELYFEDHLYLPRSVITGTPFVFAFTVHNLEHQVMTYPVEITAVDASDSAHIIPLTTTEFTLQPDESKTIPVQLSLPRLAPVRTQILVKLDNLNQSIDFWLNVASPAAKRKR